MLVVLCAAVCEGGVLPVGVGGEFGWPVHNVGANGGCVWERGRHAAVWVPGGGRHMRYAPAPSALLN